ncbi:MAG: hypothetical protein Q9187_003028 [Circinaria calcarea]
MDHHHDTAGQPPFDLTVTDRKVLALSDEEFQAHTWMELRQIIQDNNLSVLKRRPSDLRRYMRWTNEIKTAYGSITNFICQERLHWHPLSVSTESMGPTFRCASTAPLSNPDDYKILRNDWPYGLATDITHLVVWLKHRLPTNGPEGDLAENARQRIQEFVQKEFVDKLANDNDSNTRVMWFRNWTGLQSVRGLEHFHVLVRGVPDAILQEWLM